MQKETNNWPSTRLARPLPTVTQEFLSTATSNATFPGLTSEQERQTLIRSLTTFLQDVRYGGTIQEAFEGYNIKKAYRHAPNVVEHAMIAMIKHVSDTIDANKRLSTAQDYVMCMDNLLGSNFGGNYTFEDFRIICQEMIVAKYFERCKHHEFVDAWNKYDDRKTEEARRRSREIAKNHEFAMNEQFKLKRTRIPYSQ